MQQAIIELFQTNPQVAIMISLLLSIAISILGVVPSVFLTAANLIVFGFWGGLFLSFAGEVLGATVSFFLYRKGFKRLNDTRAFQYPKVQKLLQANQKEAFALIISLRILPFIPSGLVTFVAAVGQTTFFTFFIANMIGKIPAIMIESLSVYQLLHVSFEWKIGVTILGLGVLMYIMKKVGVVGRGS